MLKFRKKEGLFLLLLVLASAALREKWLFSSLEYDEIWTLQFFAGKPLPVIFTDLATPNNHPLNTLCVKLSAFLFPDMPLMIRLVPFLAGVGSVLLIWFLTMHLFRSRVAAWTAALLTMAAPPLIFYSATARGYSLQLFLILLFALLLCKSEKKPLLLIPAVISGILAVVTLTTSVLWLFPVSLLFYGTWIRKKTGKLILQSTAAFAVLGLFVLAWCIGNYDGLTAGQSRFGVAVSGLVPFFRFAGDTLYQVCGAVLLFFTVIGILFAFRSPKRKKTAAGMLFTLLFPLCAVLFTRSGPPRVYLAIFPVCAMVSGYAAAVLPLRRTWFLLAGVLACCVFFMTPVTAWQRTDWYAESDALSKLPPNVYFAVRPTEGYPLIWNLKEKAGEFAERLHNIDAETVFLQLDSERITALGPDGNETAFSASAGTTDTGSFRAHHFTVKEFNSENIRKGGYILFRFRQIPYSWRNQLLQFVSGLPGIKKAGIINFWLTARSSDPEGNTDLLLIAEPDSGTVDTDALRQAVSRLRTGGSLFTILPSEPLHR